MNRAEYFRVYNNQRKEYLAQKARERRAKQKGSSIQQKPIYNTEPNRIQHVNNQEGSLNRIQQSSVYNIPQVVDRIQQSESIQHVKPRIQQIKVVDNKNVLPKVEQKEVEQKTETKL